MLFYNDSAQLEETWTKKLDKIFKNVWIQKLRITHGW